MLLLKGVSASYYTGSFGKLNVVINGTKRCQAVACIHSSCEVSLLLLFRMVSQRQLAWQMSVEEHLDAWHEAQSSQLKRSVFFSRF